MEQTENLGGGGGGGARAPGAPLVPTPMQGHTILGTQHSEVLRKHHSHEHVSILS